MRAGGRGVVPAGRWVSPSGGLFPGVPDVVRHGTCTAVDGTLRGHRNNLYNYGRSGLSTDEISSAYKTSQSEDAVGNHFANRQKMCTFVHCETDSVVTGGRTERYDMYSWYHLVYGQVQPTEEVVTPSACGFQKRFHMLWHLATLSHQTQE